MTLLRIALFVLLCGAIPDAARAQTMDMAKAETVAIAFYKFAGLTPKFSSWAEDTDAYQNAPVARRDEVRAQEAARLGAAYQAFSPSGTLMNVTTEASVTLEEKQDKQDTGKMRYLLSWEYTKGDADFFPYKFRNDFFALVPNDLKKFQSAEITGDQYRYLKDRIGHNNRAVVILQLRGQYADARAPVHLRGEDFWALSANVAGVSLWDPKGSILWENTASWYVSPRTQSLNDLHQEKTE